MRDNLVPGAKYRLTFTVGTEQTVSQLLPAAPEFRSMPKVLATGFLVGLMEWACMRAVAHGVEVDEFTVGTHVEFSHDAPSVVGSVVEIDVELVEVDRRQLTFSFEARDEAATIAIGRHRRAVVGRERFDALLDSRRDGVEVK